MFTSQQQKLSVLYTQLRLPIRSPLALLANKLAEGMLGLRWAKVKVGSGGNAVVKTVQVVIHCLCTRT